MQQPNLIPTGPADMRLRTIRGYDFSEVSSAMQKAVRRGETQLAGYWALELWASGFGNYVWKRLLTISAEDCWGIITSAVKALHDGYALINANIPARQSRGRIFISKAVILLSEAKKSRDADQLADELRSSPGMCRFPHMPTTATRAEGRRRVKPRRSSSRPNMPRSVRSSLACSIIWWTGEVV